MAPTHDALESIFQAARQTLVNVSDIEDGFEQRVLARLSRAPQGSVSALSLIPAWNPAPVFAVLCLLVLAWAMLAPQMHLDLMGGALNLFDMESYGQVLPVNLQHFGPLS